MSVTSCCLDILITLAIVIGKYILSQTNKSELDEKLPGPKTLPVLGNALTFWCPDEDLFEKLTKCIGSYPSPMRLSNGLKTIIIFKEATQVEKIFSSAAFATKDSVYKFISIIYGEGLISGSGAKWKKDKRLMSPLFLKRNITQYFAVILKHTGILVDKLDQKVGAPTFNIEHYIRRAAADFVNESIIGAKTKAQTGQLDEFLASFRRAYKLIHRRMFKPWLQINILCRLTGDHKQLAAAKSVIHGFFWQILRQAKESHSHLGQKNDAIRTVLEQMLDIRDEIPDFATDEEIIHHLTTLYSASEDAITTACAFALVLLGMYPDCQNKAADEILTIIGNGHEIREDHLSKMEYLEMVMKETLRLFPIAPFIMREASQDVELEGFKITKGMSVMVSIHNIHRDSSQWERPNDFYPDHFLPQAVENRHPYAYLPFSAGLRGCIGKPYSYMAMKIVLVSILQRYVIEADGSLKDEPLTADVSVRFKNRKYPIRIRKRI